jgi:hypothetical protein
LFTFVFASTIKAKTNNPTVNASDRFICQTNVSDNALTAIVSDLRNSYIEIMAAESTIPKNNYQKPKRARNPKPFL